MTRPPQYASKDRNHDALVGVFVRMGCTVLETIRTGIPGMPDLTVGCLKIWHVVEIKNPETAYGRKGLNDNQTAFQRDSNGEPVYVVQTEDGVVALVNEWRRAKPVTSKEALASFKQMLGSGP